MTLSLMTITRFFLPWPSAKKNKPCRTVRFELQDGILCVLAWFNFLFHSLTGAQFYLI